MMPARPYAMASRKPLPKMNHRMFRSVRIPTIVTGRSKAGGGSAHLGGGDRTDQGGPCPQPRRAR
ncbi:hypothetical protein GCM10028775_07270 [Catellatospora paridis]